VVIKSKLTIKSFIKRGPKKTKCNTGCKRNHSKKR
jgi:hypothetical protein